LSDHAPESPPPEDQARQASAQQVSTEKADKALTIGAVVQSLRGEFPDISVSKIRYLEDQRLLAPKRTPGGYRVYSGSDVVRLRAILRMQRDEFLPLRVIRQELAAGRGDGEASKGPREQGGGGSPSINGGVSVLTRASFHRQADLLAEVGADESLLRDLSEYGLIAGHKGADGTLYDDAEREIVRTAATLARFGITARHLRTFRSSADREAGLLQQLLGPALHSRNPDRRKEALDVLDDLAVSVSRLSHLLLVRDLRRIVE